MAKINDSLKDLRDAEMVIPNLYRKQMDLEESSGLSYV